MPTQHPIIYHFNAINFNICPISTISNIYRSTAEIKLNFTKLSDCNNRLFKSSKPRTILPELTIVVEEYSLEDGNYTRFAFVSRLIDTIKPYGDGIPPLLTSISKNILTNSHQVYKSIIARLRKRRKLWDEDYTRIQETAKATRAQNTSGALRA